MALTLEMRLPLAAAGLAVVLVGPGCLDIVGADFAKYVEREEKRFTTTGKPDVRLSTFDGSIEIRPWDRAEVQVIVEKRASTKEAAADIDVRSEQNGNQVTIEVKAPKTSGFHFNTMRSARLIVSLPATSDILARSGDGSIDIGGVGGRLELRSGDGSIRGRDLNGNVTVHTGDGSIRLDGVHGALNVDTGDGSIVVAGQLTSVRARSGDGSVSIRAQSGSTPSGDWDITTGDGSVTVELPEGFGAELDAHSGDGRVRTENLTLSNVTGTMDRNSLRGRVGAGGPKLRVRTGDGSITLKRS